MNPGTTEAGGFQGAGALRARMICGRLHPSGCEEQFRVCEAAAAADPVEDALVGLESTLLSLKMLPSDHAFPPLRGVNEWWEGQERLTGSSQAGTP